jgi:uncharacterized protein (DUF736 family)
MLALNTLARWIAGLLAVSAVVFAIATVLEHREGAPKPAPTQQVAEEGTEAGEAAEHQAGKAREEFLGVNLESPWLVWGFVVVSLALSAAVLRLWTPAFALTVVVAGMAAILDAREAINQFGIKDVVAILAVLIGVAHLAAAILAVVALTKFRTGNQSVA